MKNPDDSQVIMKQELPGIVLLLVLFLAWAVFLNTLPGLHSAAFQVDTSSYMGMAVNLLENGSFFSANAGELDLFRTPVYPLFLSAVRVIFGESVRAIINCQIALLGILVVLIYRMGKFLGDHRTGLAAGISYLVMGTSWVSSVVILTEVVFSTFLLFSVYFLCRFSLVSEKKWLFFSSLFLGAAALTRPVGLLVYLVWGLSFLVIEWRKKKFRVFVNQFLSFNAPAGFLILSWMVRNWRVWNRFTLSTIGGWNMKYYLAAEVLSKGRQIPLEEARSIVLGLSSGVFHEDVTSVLSIFFRFPFSLLRTLLRSTALTLSGLRVSLWTEILGGEDFLSEIASTLNSNTGVFTLIPEVLVWLFSMKNPLLIIILLVSAAVLMWAYWWNIVLIVGVVKSGWRHGWFLLFVIIMVAVLVVSPAAVGNSRFRVPVEPYLALFSATAFIRYVDQRRLSEKWKWLPGNREREDDRE